MLQSTFISLVQTTLMVYSDYLKQRILFYHQLGKSYADISLCLSEEGHKASKLGVLQVSENGPRKLGLFQVVAQP